MIRSLRRHGALIACLAVGIATLGQAQAAPRGMPGGNFHGGGMGREHRSFGNAGIAAGVIGGLLVGTVAAAAATGYGQAEAYPYPTPVYPAYGEMPDDLYPVPVYRPIGPTPPRCQVAWRHWIDSYGGRHDENYLACTR